MLRLWHLLIALATLSLITANAHAQTFGDDFDTDFTVTVLAKDGKFIGDTMGGVRVIVRDKLTGDIMVDGHTYGTTGDTETIMADNIPRNATLSNNDSARFEFSLAILEPTKVTITAIAPLSQMQNAVTVTEDITLIPGKDYTSGDGIRIEMPGIAVKVQSPLPNEAMTFDPEVPLTIAANVMKLCGCKIAKDSPWDPEDYDIEAYIYKGTQFITALPLQYAGSAGQYMTRVKIPLPGDYKVTVTAFDKNTKEGGMDTTTVSLVEKTD